MLKRRTLISQVTQGILVLTLAILLAGCKESSAVKVSTLSLQSSEIKAMKQNKDWVNAIQKKAIKLANNGQVDESAYLHVAQSIPSNVTIIGLGESTHGTQEFFHAKHQMIIHLVRDLGFNALILEANYAAVKKLNSYVLTGEGDLPQLINNLGSLMWNVEEFFPIIEWIKDFNQSQTSQNKVSLHGVDIMHNRLLRKRLQDFIQWVDSENIESFNRLNAMIEQEEQRWGQVIMDDKHEKNCHLILSELQRLLERFDLLQDKILLTTSLADYREHKRYIEILMQWARMGVTDFIPAPIPKVPAYKNLSRSQSMAKNTMRLIEDQTDQRKYILWAHNYHIASGFPDATHGHLPNMGAVLKDSYQQQYYAIGLDTYRGDYLAREYKPTHRNLSGELTIAKIISAPEYSLPWYFFQTHLGDLFFDLQKNKHSPNLKAWLDRPIDMHMLGWMYFGAENITISQRVQDYYDAIIHIEVSSPTTPTQWAKQVVIEQATIKQ